MVSAETGTDTVHRGSVPPGGQLVPVVGDVRVNASVPLPAYGLLTVTENVTVATVPAARLPVQVRFGPRTTRVPDGGRRVAVVGRVVEHVGQRHRVRDAGVSGGGGVGDRDRVPDHAALRGGGGVRGGGDDQRAGRDGNVQALCRRQAEGVRHLHREGVEPHRGRGARQHPRGRVQRQPGRQAAGGDRPGERPGAAGDRERVAVGHPACADGGGGLASDGTAAITSGGGLGGGAADGVGDLDRERVAAARRRGARQQASAGVQRQPGGRLPALTDQVSAPVPPVAVSWSL